MSGLTRILILEDVPEDAELIVRELRQAGMEFESVCMSTRDVFLKELEDFSPDLILADYSLPSYDGFTALEDHQRAGNGAPFIFVSGKMGEETAIEAMKNGATDYVLKQRLGRLAPAVQRALHEVEDHSERLRAEAETARGNAVLEGVNRILKGTLTCESDEELTRLCLSVVDALTQSKFSFIREPSRSDSMNVIAVSGTGHDVSSMMNKADAEARTKEMEIRGIWAGVIREDQPLIKNDLVSHPDGLGTPEGYPALIAYMSVPLKNSDEYFGSICLCNKQSGYDREDLEAVETVAPVIVEALLHKRAQQREMQKSQDLAQAEGKLRKGLADMRKAMGGVIQAFSLTVESRDPYTAGHQQRVADLARAIAKDMGLDHERIEAIRMGGSIHDQGKMQVPAEILSKPGRLTPLEFEMIKLHPKTGYEILKDVDFPWDIARLVLQHHERLDGSGYPAGISGEGIDMESRIMAVADVVEAMSSHRPYRPALGIEKALEEIVGKKGVAFDADAVDACVRIFKAGYRFDTDGQVNKNLLRNANLPEMI